jgi:hypothetical protein
MRVEDSIMCPDVGHASRSNWSPTYDTRAAGKMIDMLDNETQAGSSGGSQLTNIRQGLQQYLNGDALTELYVNPVSSLKPIPDK